MMARLKTKSAEDTRQIAVYVRKSKITETGKSIEIQKEKCISLACARFDIDAGDVLVYEDEGKSGFYADRPQYKRMLRDIEDNKIRAVVCYKIDRISRRTIDLLNLVQQMEQKGIAFVSVSDKDIDTSTKTGKIMIALLSAIAEFERDIIAERITDNMYELAKEGRWLGGKCPLGYYSKKTILREGNRKTSVNHLEPVPDEQVAVKRLYELFLQKGSYCATFTALNDEGFKTSNGKQFTSIAVKSILENPVYAVADKDMQGYFCAQGVSVWANDEDFDGIRGMIGYNKTEQTKEIDKDSRTLDPQYVQKSARRDVKDWIISVGKHEGIIRGADWIRVQSIIANISKDQSARANKEASNALLSGIMRCVKCGGKMYVRAESGRKNPDGTTRYSYYCGSRRNKDWNCDSPPTVRGYETDNFVIAQICSIASGTTNAFYNELLNTKNALSVKTQETEKELIQLRKRLAKIETEIKQQMVNLRTAPEIVKQELYADIESLGAERDEKQARLNELQEATKSQDSQVADIEKAKQAILDFPRLVNIIDYEGKLQLLNRILECVIVKNDTVHIFLKGSEPSSSFTKPTERSDSPKNHGVPLSCHTEPHSILYASYCIGCKAGAFVGLESCNAFYQSYCCSVCIKHKRQQTACLSLL